MIRIINKYRKLPNQLEWAFNTKYVFVGENEIKNKHMYT